MQEILSDLVAEQQALDQFLQSVPIRRWATPTPAKGWDVRDTVSHLAHSEEYAFNAVAEDGSRLVEVAQFAEAEEATQRGVEQGRQMRPQQVIEWWREARAQVVDALSRLDGSERIPWFAGPMSARTFASARLMETWAHGLDIHTALGNEPEDTPRLRHVARLGWLTLPYAFSVAGEDYPEPIRVDLRAPGYQRWTFGPDDAGQVVRGPAGDWCRVVVRRKDAADTELVAEGELAETALRVARAYL